ncbi:MAG TPA: polysaccharide deacetylase family protein [Myxococcota bacterium]|nr:polysaccharide deacetylase family protein [Myxococcota bacterium]
MASGRAVERLCAVSVDLDTLGHYRGLHGLDGPADAAGAGDAIYERCLPRFTALFAEAGVPATFFAIGADLARPAAAAALRRAAEAGHEIGNHSLRHLYDLSLCDETTVRAEVSLGHEAIAAAVGPAHAPRGFRAPGYNLSPAILEAVAAQGYRWDSSIFPCPPYYLAKWTVMAGMAVRGRSTRAVRGAARQLFAPRAPFRPRRGSIWRAAPPGAGDDAALPLLEIPIGVLPGARAPYIGTFLVLAGRGGARFMTSWMARARLVNLELHGIDLCDAAEDGVEAALVARQHDLRVSGADKREIFARTLAQLARTHRFVTLSEVGAHYSA